MNVLDSVLPSVMIVDRLASFIFDGFIEDGPVVAIVDNAGGCEASDSEVFARAFMDKNALEHVCNRVDDGSDPVVTQIGEFGLVASEIRTRNGRLGHVLVLLPESSPENTLSDMSLIEAMFHQISVIAELIEQGLESQIDSDMTAELCLA